MPTRFSLRSASLFPAGIYIAVAWFGLAACQSPEEFYEEADREAYALVGAAREFEGQRPEPDFNIEPRRDRIRDSVLPPREEGRRPDPRQRLAVQDQIIQINSINALQLAAENSREFQSQKENLYRSALALTGDYFAFDSQYFGTVGANANVNGDGVDDATVSLGENSILGMTKTLERGGSLSLDIGQNFTRFLTNPALSTAGALFNFSLRLPFLQGAGRLVAFERVRQSERDLLYAVRDYERFKREFAVDIISSYLNLLQAAQRVENNRNNLERRRNAAEEERLLGEAGRAIRTDVERANLAVLNAETALLNAEIGLENSLDSFKLQLGLPTDAKVQIDAEDVKRLEQLEIDMPKLDEERAMMIALDSRLDFAISESQVADARRQVEITKNALLAGLDFSADFGAGTNDFGETDIRFDPIGNSDLSLGVLLDLPLNRINERNAYRSSFINWEVAKRNAEAFEDQVKLQARRALRSLRQSAENYRIQKRSLEVAKTTNDAALLLKASGDGNTNDLVDAQNALIAAQNDLIASVVDYQIDLLSLERDLGVLVVNPEGIDEEMTKRLLEREF
jgi:outer membrane protein TolC